MTPFNFHPQTRFVFAPGALTRLGDLAAELGAQRALVVSDPGVIAAGHTARGIASLEAQKIACQLFDEVIENPTTDQVETGLEVARQFQPDLIVGLGGGSSLDCAKGINFLFTGGGKMQDYWGEGKATAPMLPMIAVPTTAGTGSESQSFALISDPDTGAKMACGDKKATCRVALLDPELTLTQPQSVTANTGYDALAHAVETYVSRRRNYCSSLSSRGAWELLANNFAQVLKEPDNLTARGAMQVGAAWAGLAIENSMLGAAHALANPLTAQYGIIHGQAIALMLPHVVRFNGQTCDAWYAELAALVPATREGSGSATERLAKHLEHLRSLAGLPACLADFQVTRNRLPQLAEKAASQWTGQFNPRPVDQANLLALYEAAF